MTTKRLFPKLLADAKTAVDAIKDRQQRNGQAEMLSLEVTLTNG